jgi:hypothetical protein
MVLDGVGGFVGVEIEDVRGQQFVAVLVGDVQQDVDQVEAGEEGGG